MSIHAALPPEASRVPIREYTQEKGAFIAEQYANGESFTNLSSCFPEYLPAAMYIKQWRDQYPAFNELIKLAARARADVLQEQCLAIADDTDRQAAQAANAIKVRQTLAAALDSQTYGNRRIIAGDTENPLMIGRAETLTDDQLLQIARGAVVSLPEPSDSTRSADPPYPPLLQSEAPVAGEVRGPQKPTTIPHKHSVTTLHPDNKSAKSDVDSTKKSATLKPVGVDPGF